MDFIDHRSTANFKFSLSATDEKLRIKSDGNVGIGVSNPSTKLEVDGVITTAGLTTTANINFGDNDKAIFGAGSDLQIYHDGSNSYIDDAGTGLLAIRANSGVYLQKYTGETLATFIADGGAAIYFDNAARLATTSTGIDVTGTVVSDGLTVANTAVIAGDFDGGTAATYIRLQDDTDNFLFGSNNSLGNFLIKNETADALRLSVANTGDISFYEDTGTTAKLFWDASAESLGIGTSSLIAKMHVKGAGTSSSTNAIFAENSSGAGLFAIRDNGDAFILGNTGIGTSSPSNKLDIKGTVGFEATNSTNKWLAYTYTDNTLRLNYNGSGADEITIDSSGNVGIGTSSPSGKLSISGATATNELVHATFTNTSGAKTFAIGAGQSGVTNNGFVIRNVTDNTFPLVISDAGVTSFGAGNVGILNSSPSSQFFNNLVVGNNDSGDKGITIRSNAANRGVLAFSDTDSATDGRYTGFISYDHSDNSMKFHTNGGSERLRIDSSGNVGIGTSSPDAKFHSYQSAANYAAHFESANANSYGVWVEEGASANNGYPLLSVTDNGGSTQYFRVDSGTGNVGIGTSSPTVGKLQVNDGSGAIVAITRTSGATSGNLGVIRFGNTDIDSNLVNITAIQDGATNSSALTFETQPAGGGTTERMRIDSSGMLGLGSTPPTDAHATWSQFFIGEKGSVFSEKLGSGGIYGLWLTDNDYIDADTGNHAYRTTDEASAINLEAGNTIFYRAASGTAGAALTWSESMRIDASGNLMVGKTDTSIATQGAFFGPNYSHITSTNDTPLALSRKSSDGTILDIRKDGTTVGSISSTDNSGIIIGSNDVGLRFRQQSAGAAIFPREPDGSALDATLDLGLSNSRFKDIHLSGTANVGGVAVIGTDATDVASIGTSGQRVYIKPNGTEIIYNASGNSAGQHVWQTGNAERMRIDSSGNVGIGTNSPVTFGANTHGLTINGTGHYQHLTLQNNGNSDFSLYTNGPNGTIINQESADPLHFNTDGTERMRIDASGNLLVGKTSADNTTQGIRMLGSSGFMSVVRSNDNLVVLNRIDGDGSLMEFRTSGTTRGSISISGSTTSYNTSSDQRLKDNIVDAPSASDDIDAIQVRSFDWKADGSHQKYGMVAQELQSVAPEAVSEGVTEEDMMGVDYSKLVPMMLKEIQSLRARVAQLEGAN